MAIPIHYYKYIHNLLNTLRHKTSPSLDIAMGKLLVKAWTHFMHSVGKLTMEARTITFYSDSGQAVLWLYEKFLLNLSVFPCIMRKTFPSACVTQKNGSHKDIAIMGELEWVNPM